MNSSPHPTFPRSPLERWLGSPLRLALLGSLAIVIATLATSLGEIELAGAGGIDAEDTDVIVRQGLLWLSWALVTPVLLWIAIRMGRGTRPLALVLVGHLALAAAVGSLFLCLELTIMEAAQSPEETEAYANALTRIEERRAQSDASPGGGGGRGPRPERRGPERASEGEDGVPGPGNRGEPRGAGALGADPRSADPQRTGPQGIGPQGIGPELGAADERQAGDRRPPRPFPERGRRGRWRRMAAGMNMATGDLPGDFERRWPLRVPRYALTYFALVGMGLGIRAFLQGRAQERQAAQLALRATQLETELGQARLLALKGQLHPHFLFNALHSVGGLIRSERGPSALTALASIGDLLRTSLDAEPEQFVPLAREIELVKRYLEVESLRLGDRLAIEFHVPENLLDAEVPTFITQPLVENAIKHGVAQRTEGGSIGFRARADGPDRLLIEIDDDGPGFKPRESSSGVGLAHVRGRLEVLFGDEGSLHVESQSRGGTRATITLPLDDLGGGDHRPDDRPEGGHA